MHTHVLVVVFMFPAAAAISPAAPTQAYPARTITSLLMDVTNVKIRHKKIIDESRLQ